MSIASSIKRRLHRDICANPVLHGLVLNLYLNGEQYPHRVDDYFPMAAAEENELGEQLRRHVRDEDKHIALYKKVITELQQPVLELPAEDVFNHVVRGHTPNGFRIEADDDVDQRRDKLANFLAHVHHLEQRVARSLEYHVEACNHCDSDYPGKAVAVVLNDEHRHAHYTREAVTELLPSRRARDVLALHARAEAAANRDFSATQLGRLLVRHTREFPASRRWLYRVSGNGLRALARVM